MQLRLYICMFVQVLGRTNVPAYISLFYIIASVWYVSPTMHLPCLLLLHVQYIRNLPSYTYAVRQNGTLLSFSLSPLEWYTYVRRCSLEVRYTVHGTMTAHAKRGQVYHACIWSVKWAWGLRKRTAHALHCSYIHGPFSTRMHAMWARVGHRPCLLAQERMQCRGLSRERTGLLPFHVGPGWHVTSCALHAPAVGEKQNNAKMSQKAGWG